MNNYDINRVIAKGESESIEFKEIFSSFFTRLKYIKQKISIHNNEPVNNRQKEIIKLILNNRNITIIDLANKLSAGRETIKRDLKKLKELNIIKRIGSDKTGYWEVVKQNMDA